MNCPMKTSFRQLVALWAALHVLSGAAQSAPATLGNGVSVTGISGAVGTERFYSIQVPAGQDNLRISISGGTGDCDLYVRRSSVPTVTAYDYRPYNVGNDETVTVASPAAGTWHIMLLGYSAYAGVTLLAEYSSAGTITALVNGVSVINLTGALASEKVYRIEVPSGQAKLEVEISGGTGDADLYVRRGSRPTVLAYDYRPYLVGNDETVTINNPAAGTYYIMLRGYTVYSGLTLVASYGGGTGAVLQNGVAVTSLSGAQGSEKVYRIEVPGGQQSLEITMSGGTGDADLYVKFGASPTVSVYDYRPFLPGNNETVTVNAPTAGTWHIMIRGYSEYSGVTLKATYGAITTLRDGVALSNISGALGSQKLYRLDVPSGQNQLLIRTSGGTGNCDVYIKIGAAPSTAEYDWRLNQPGNNESISIGSPQAGTWYIMLRAEEAYTGVTLAADCSVTETVRLLGNGVPVPNISGNAGSEQFYKIEVPSGQTTLEIKISGGTGDADLYVKRGSIPTTSTYDYRPYVSGNRETVTVNNPTAGTWFIMIRAYQAFSGVMLVATYSSGGGGLVVTLLQNGVAVPGISDAIAGEKYYRVEVPAAQARFQIDISGGTGDCDLYVRRGSLPTRTEWDYRPYLIANNETVSIDNPAAGTWFIMLRGSTVYTGVTLVATYFRVMDPVIVLDNAMPVLGIFGAAGSEKFYKITVPPGQNFLAIEISGGTGDCDLYIKKGAKPTTASWDYRSDLPRNNEKVEIDDPAATTWYIMLRGYSVYSGVTLVATYGPAGNDFTSDPRCIALWRFEPAQLTTDSIGTNTLTNYGAEAVTTQCREGSGCARFDATFKDYMRIADGHLAASFPLKDGDRKRKITVCYWVNVESLPNSPELMYVFGKYDSVKDFRSIATAVKAGGETGLIYGYDNGRQFDQIWQKSAAKRILPNRWYHMAFAFNGQDRSYRIRVYDETAGVLLFDDSGTALYDISATAAAVTIGNLAELASKRYFDGCLDELVVFADVLTGDEIDRIRQGKYGRLR